MILFFSIGVNIRCMGRRRKGLAGYKALPHHVHPGKRHSLFPKSTWRKSRACPDKQQSEKRKQPEQKDIVRMAEQAGAWGQA